MKSKYSNILMVTSCKSLPTAKCTLSYIPTTCEQYKLVLVHWEYVSTLPNESGTRNQQLTLPY